MNLSIKDRLMLNAILPVEGGIITMLVVKQIQKSIAIMPEEVKEFNIQEKNGNLTFSEKGLTEKKSITFDDSEIEVIRTQLRKMDSEQKITLDHIDVYQMFMSEKTDVKLKKTK